MTHFQISKFQIKHLRYYVMQVLVIDDTLLKGEFVVYHDPYQNKMKINDHVNRDMYICT